MESVFSGSALCKLQRGDNRYYQYSAKEVADAVNTVIGQTGDNPGNHFWEAQPIQKRLRRRVERPV